MWELSISYFHKANKITYFRMKNQFLVTVALIVVLSCVGTFGAIGGYDYCGKPCTDGGGMVCASNGICTTWFISKCEMKKRNCDHDDRFNESPFSSCFFGKKCRI